MRIAYTHSRPFRGGLVFKAHRLVYHLTLGLKVIKKKKPESTMLLGRRDTRKVDVRLPEKKEFKLPLREAGPPNHHDDKVDSDQ